MPSRTITPNHGVSDGYIINAIIIGITATRRRTAHKEKLARSIDAPYGPTCPA
jgi:hypothetical protein